VTRLASAPPLMDVDDGDDAARCVERLDRAPCRLVDVHRRRRRQLVLVVRARAVEVPVAQDHPARLQEAAAMAHSAQERGDQAAANEAWRRYVLIEDDLEQLDRGAWRATRPRTTRQARLEAIR
jgi:hypothetical protein